MSKEYLIGSLLLGLENPKDYDCVKISDDYDYYWTFDNVTKKDCLHINLKQLMKYLTFSENFNKPIDCKRMLANYQIDIDIIKQDFPVEYHLLDHKNDLIKLLKFVKINKMLNFSKENAHHGCVAKSVYHIAYNIFILRNNSTILTKEQKEIIQDIHDLVMPIDYIDTLYKYIDDLEYTEGDNND